MKTNILHKYYIILIFIIGTYSFFIIPNQISDLKEYDKKIDIVEVIKEQEISKETTLYFVGDIMLTRGVETSVKNNFGGDYNKLFINIPELKKADILFGNLEGPVSDVGNNVGSKYSFRMNPIVLPALKNAGFDIVSFANNHVGDWNLNAFSDTLERLKVGEISVTGAGINKDEAKKPTIIEKNNVKFGFLGFSDVGPAWMAATEVKPGILLASDPDMDLIIQNAKSISDVLIVSFHFGEEYKTIHNSRQEILAHRAIDNGADIVIGHHPHVMEDIEEYKGKIIIYSLGNFIFDQYFSENTMRGMLYSTTFSGKDIVKTEKKIVLLNKKYQPIGIFLEKDLPKKVEQKKSEIFTCVTPKIEYADMSLFPVGKVNILPDITYIPKNLLVIKKDYSTKDNICLTKEARDNFEKMLTDAKKEGYIIKGTSGFRSYDYQKNLLLNFLRDKKITETNVIAEAGHSEHQLGTTIDITSESIEFNSTSIEFNKTNEYNWMKNNASSYGFVESYPYGKESITGYDYEPWHYRYVGINNAKEITLSGLTTNEYLEKLE